MELYVFPYKMESEGAKVLAAELGVKRIKREGSRFKGSNRKTVINWGSRTLIPEIEKCNVLNKPEAITTCSDKLRFFNALKDRGIARYVDFTTDIEQAKAWVNEGKVVMCRTVVNGHSGQGIVIAETVDEVVQAPLYTLYVPKKQEYRIHLFRGEPFVTQRKALANPEQVGNVNWKIRNLANGFVFARNEDREVPEDVYIQAKAAFNSIDGLDFGSVDVIWNEHRQQAFVLEINTASGLTGSTITDYAEKFKQAVRSLPMQTYIIEKAFLNRGDWVPWFVNARSVKDAVAKYNNLMKHKNGWHILRTHDLEGAGIQLVDLPAIAEQPVANIEYDWV